MSDYINEIAPVLCSNLEDYFCKSEREACVAEDTDYQTIRSKLVQIATQLDTCLFIDGFHRQQALLKIQELLLCIELGILNASLRVNAPGN